MVTSPHKYGALFFPIGSALIQASSAGDAIATVASQPAEAEPQGYGGSVFSTRGSGGWSSRTIATPNSRAVAPALGEGEEYRFFSEDLSHGVVQPRGNFTPLSAEASESTPYMRNDYLNGHPPEQCASGCFQPLVSAANVPSGTVFGEEPNGQCEHGTCGPAFLGASPDLGHVIFQSPVQLTSIPIGRAEDGLYEWAGGRLRLVSVLPEGEVAEGGGGAAYRVWLGNPGDGSARHAVSDDGSRIVWTGTTERGGFAHLYLSDTVKGETVRLDKPQGGGSEGTGSFMLSSSDGSRIFFLGERLTEDSSPSGRDLYEYDVNAAAGSRLRDITPGGQAGGASMVAEVLGASEDGSYVYFAAGGALAPGAKHGECGNNSEPPGDKELCNVYVRHGGVTRFVAGLSAEDFPDWGNGGGLEKVPARVSPDGRWLTFASNRSLTGYDTRDAVSGRPDEEVYLYDASADHMVCASCNPTGARPVGVEYGTGGQGGDTNINRLVGEFGWKNDSWFAANVPMWTKFSGSQLRYQSRYLSDSGRLFFDSSDALVPQDVNGTQDVYEFEPVGVGDCTASGRTFSERSGGCVGLISSGTSPEESGFLDASQSGGDVFFLTESKLAPQDFDTAHDVYDAHECTSQVPCFAQPPASPPACSTGDSCKPAPSPQPSVFGSPSSATFSGAGNVSAEGPAKGVTSKSLTRARKLARALRVCAKKHGRGQRGVCERKARRRYAATKSGANAKRGSGR
jgi:hypothetical protein